MATIGSFEDLEVWKKARVLTKNIYKISRRNPFCRDFKLSGQIQDSAVSIMANIAEGHERDGHREFIQHLSIAKGSCGEVRSHLYAAYDQDYLSENELRLFLSDAKEISRMLAGFINYLKKSNIKGIKYKSP